MNDIQKAIAKRLEKKIEDSGYVLDAGQALGAMSEIWLYSCNAAGKKIKQRASFQLTFDAYRAITERSEHLYCELEEDEQMLLHSLYSKYDNDGNSVSAEEKQLLSFLLLKFALSNKLNHDHEIAPGMHFIVVDIPNDSGFGLCGFAVADHPCILTNDEVVEAVEFFVEQVNFV